MDAAFHIFTLTGAVIGFVFLQTVVSLDLAFVASTGALIIWLAIAEGWLGKREPALDPEEKRTDIAYSLLAPVVPALVNVAFTFIALRIEMRGPLETLSQAIPTWLMVALTVLAADLGSYAVHRTVHRVPFLYRFHEIHHSSRALSWLNASRLHPVDTFLNQFFTVGPMVLLGAPPLAVAVAGFVGQTGAFLQHSRVAVHGGALSRLFQTSLTHRVHHREDLDAPRNFGGTLMIWDQLFGTYQSPENAVMTRTRPLGPNRAFPSGLLRHLKEPFRSKGHP